MLDGHQGRGGAQPQTPNRTAVPAYEPPAVYSAASETTTAASAASAVGRAPNRSVKDPPSQLPTMPARPKTSRSDASARPLPPVTLSVTAELKM
nr:hypothetical protein GCM10025730_33410 [Promicromonospora thailandica]